MYNQINRHRSSKVNPGRDTNKLSSYLKRRWFWIMGKNTNYKYRCHVKWTNRNDKKHHSNILLSKYSFCKFFQKFQKTVRQLWLSFNKKWDRCSSHNAKETHPVAAPFIKNLVKATLPYKFSINLNYGFCNRVSAAAF